jgi:ribosome-binding factor A
MHKKIGRTNDDIQHVLSVLLRDIKDPRVRQGMISITGVETTIDLRQAKVFVSAFDIESEKELLKGLQSATGHLRSELARSLGLRNTPELIFELDNSIAHGSRINELLSEMDLPKESGDDSSGDDNL